jgi:hypothetical protein
LTICQVNAAYLPTECQSTFPMRGATRSLLSLWICSSVFQSTLPMRGATFVLAEIRIQLLISIHAPHAGSDARYSFGKDEKYISIHAPHAGSDTASRSSWLTRFHFNPRSPCGERLNTFGSNAEDVKFQSTLPMRGATPLSGRTWSSGWYFNPRSPCGERPSRIVGAIGNVGDFNPRSPCGERLEQHARIELQRAISIHAPHAGSDLRRTISTVGYGISIHAPHAGSDRVGTGRRGGVAYFNPRSPCGERLEISTTLCSRGYFNPRSPCGERRTREVAHEGAELSQHLGQANVT